MKIFRFFLTRIFLKKPILAISTLLLLFMANYITFSTARAVFATQEGHEQMARINASGTFIANVDPQATVNFNTTESIQDVYDYLDENYQYAFYTDNYIASLANRHGIGVPVSYMNQRYNDLNGFAIAAGSVLTFDYSLDKGETIPVLVGKGLADDYPLGSQFTMHDPALQRNLTLKVAGILAENPSHSNFYALDSKSYYNFSIIIPATKAFIEQANIGIKVNGLMDLIITDTDSTGASKLGAYIEQAIKVKFNFFSQQDNIDFYNEYFVSSMLFLGAVSSVLLILIVGLSVWSSLVSVRVMVREFTINFLVGLSYSKVRRLFYSYYAGLSFIALATIAIMASYSRYSYWQNKETSFMTYGFAGLIEMDWLALLVACLFDLLLVALVVQTITWRLKRVHISVGVLQ